ncbi:hypothetical protein [Streptomyces sp. H27-C3]|uniref:hypothetical protein n=1 Tax=Streptomyces sp. H27-C3 TaxID=3046305 RepID=UPI0024BBD0D8|nr:hypothetical protein [Streptomyces sp. H27-C3]MDJ0465156.1 hypothetical protein [Streptomyces sp. H27-C3]
MNPQQALVIEADKMKGFKKRVDDLLTELDKSEAAPDRMADDRLVRAHLGSEDFHEAQYLFESYSVVHEELEKLSKALGTQIEGMGLAVHASRVGYENVDVDIRDRMAAINAQAEKYYDKDRDPTVQEPVGGPAKKDTSKETGF